jgi:tRNA wybutosine-synthesizing protein 3
MVRFEMQRDKAMKQLAEARSDGKADEDIAELVDIINSNENLYTTSSCAGRIAVLQTPKGHDKLESSWLGKWHHEVTLQNLEDALSKHDKYVVYLQSECPILHVVAKTQDDAERILFLARECGFKRSGIHSLKEERILIEICSTETLEVPLAESGKTLVDEKYLEYLVGVANTKFRAGRVKLARLQEKLEE